MVGEQLYVFKNKTLAVASSTLAKIERWQEKSSDKIEGLVDKMKQVHEFLQSVCEFPSAMLNLRDILGEWAPLAELLGKIFPDLMSKLKDAIETFEKPMKDALKIVEQVRDVVGTLAKTAEQATSFDVIKDELVGILKGARASSRAMFVKSVNSTGWQSTI